MLRAEAQNCSRSAVAANRALSLSLSTWGVSHDTGRYRIFIHVDVMVHKNLPTASYMSSSCSCLRYYCYDYTIIATAIIVVLVMLLLLAVVLSYLPYSILSANSVK